MSKGAFFLKHDLNTRRDPKVSRLLRAHGLRGYGIFWAIAEDLHEQGGAIDADFEQIAFDLREEIGVIEAVVSGFGLFVVEDGKIRSPRVDRNLDEREAAASSGREAIARRTRPDGSPWVKDRGLVGTYNDPSTRRGEERREEERTDKDMGAVAPRTFTPPTIEEVKAYCLDRKNKVDPERWHDFYASKGWLIGKNKMKDWRAAVRTWERSDSGGFQAAPRRVVGGAAPVPGKYDHLG